VVWFRGVPLIRFCVLAAILIAVVAVVAAFNALLLLRFAISASKFKKPKPEKEKDLG
jgi:hypothetical protein